MTDQPQPFHALALSGGVALGAYEAGAYAALHAAGALPRWIAGVSAGAVNGALIAGNPPERQIERLRAFWRSAAREPMPLSAFWFGAAPRGPWREAEAVAAALQSHLFGCPAIFRPRLGLPSAGAPDVSALYDLSPLRQSLENLVDFARLNSGETRFTLAATDINSGERVVFDTARGDRIGPEHLLASSALPPLFAPLEIGGRLLGDGGLAGNLPLDLVLDELPDEEVVIFAVELFSRRGQRPRSLGASTSRAVDIAMGNQTRRMLEGREREHRLRRMIAQLPPELRQDPRLATLVPEGRGRCTAILCLGYRAELDEAGLGKPFDFSPHTLWQRWNNGEADMCKALQQLGQMPHEPGLHFHEIDSGKDRGF